MVLFSLVREELLLLLLLLGGGGRGASRGRVYVFVSAGFSSRIVMGTRGSGHWGVGGVWAVDGRHIGDVLVLAAEKSPLNLSLLRLFWRGGVGKAPSSKDGRAGAIGTGLGVTGMGSCEPDCLLFILCRLFFGGGVE